MSAGFISASAAGYYYNNAYTNKAISIFFNPIDIAYDENFSAAINVEYTNNNSPGYVFDFIAKNLNITQYS